MLNNRQQTELKDRREVNGVKDETERIIEQLNKKPAGNASRMS